VENKSNQKLKRFSKVIGLSVLLVFFVSGYAAGTPHQIGTSDFSTATGQDLYSENSTRSIHSFARLEDHLEIFPKISGSESAEKNMNGLVGDTTNTNTVPEPSTMLLFASAVLGMATIGRKKFLKR
jgi:hypothetical protein